MGKQYSAAPAMVIDVSKTYVAHFHTSRGDFDVSLLTAEAPLTVNNFVFLSRRRFL